MMDEKIREYRSKHKNCDWCKYNRYRTYIHWTDCSFQECVLKDEIIKFNKLKAKFCKYYELKGDNDEI